MIRVLPTKPFTKASVYNIQHGHWASTLSSCWRYWLFELCLITSPFTLTLSSMTLEQQRTTIQWHLNVHIYTPLRWWKLWYKCFSWLCCQTCHHFACNNIEVWTLHPCITCKEMWCLALHISQLLHVYRDMDQMLGPMLSNLPITNLKLYGRNKSLQLYIIHAKFPIKY